MISEQTIELVKSTMKVKDVVGAFVELKKKGVNYVGKCPFHNEKTPSFTVSEAKEMYKCFGCGKSGDPIAFLIDHEKLTYLDAIKWIANKYTIPVEETEKKEPIKPVPRLEKLGKKALQWFENDRKISNNTLLRLGLTESVEYMPQHQKEVSVICFNYFRDEQLVNIKFRGPQKAFTLSKDGELIFYNLDAIKGEKECVIVEGEIDCLTLHECGIYNSISVPNGATHGKQRLEYLDNCYSYFTGMEKIILASDNDYPGNNLREELARRLGKERCYQVTYPEGCKDFNDVLVKFGKDKVVEVIQSATRWPVEGIVVMEEILPEVADYYENGYPKGADTKIPDFDLLFSPGELTIVTGIPGSGKDEWVNYVTTSLSRFYDWKWGYIGMEETPQITTTKLIEKFTGKSFAFRKNEIHRVNQREFEYGVGMVDKYYHFVNVNKVEVTVTGILNKSKELVERFGINGLVISPWNCLEHKIQYGLTETLYISEKLTEIINFLGRYGIHCFLLAHPRKVEKNRQTGKYNIPTLYDISGSANFYNKTHNGICVYRDFDTGQVDIYRQKVKNWWNGSVGYSSYFFNQETRQYSMIGALPVPQELGNGTWKPYVEN